MCLSRESFLRALRTCSLATILIMIAFLCNMSLAVPVLDVSEDSDSYTIRARDDVNTATAYWELRVDKLSGGIFSFVDLTDSGDGLGGHTNYLGADAYNRAVSLLCFDGRGGDVFRRGSAVADQSDRLSFEAGPDGAWFKITYSESPEATDFFHDSYEATASLSPGELLTTITMFIRPPYQIGTFFDWSVACENVSDHDISDKVWAAEYVKLWLDATIAKSSDTDSSQVDGPWNPASPVSFARWTIGDNSALGLTSGLEFIMDCQSSPAIYGSGCGVSQSAWAGFDYLRFNSPFDYNTTLPAGDTRYMTGQLIIGVSAPDGGIPSDNQAPVANAGEDITVTDVNRNGQESLTLDASASSDSDGVIVNYEWYEDAVLIASGTSPQLNFAVGTHELTLTVTDDDGDSDDDIVVVTVNSPLPGDPTADAGVDQDIVDVDDSGSEDLTLDGSGSYDPDGEIVSWLWSEDGQQIATGMNPVVTLTLGEHEIELTVTDDSGAISIDSSKVTVWPPVEESVYYLDAVNGSDSNPGTSLLPWLTFEKALTTADTGDIVYVRPGNYGKVELESHHNLGTPAGYITYKADPDTCRARPEDWWDVELPADFSDPADRAVLSYLRVQNPSSSGLYMEFDGFDIVQDESRPFGFMVGALNYSTHIRLRNLNVFCWWADDMSPIYFQHGYGSDTEFHDILVEGCFVRDGNNGIRLAGDTGSNIVIRDNHLYHSAASALQMLDGISNDTILLEHNHIHFQDPLWDPNGGGGVGDYSHGSGISIRRENLIIRRNIIHAHGTSRGVYTYSGSSEGPDGYCNILIENNLFYDTNNYPLEITALGDNVVIRNNTIIGYKLDPGSDRLGMTYYVGFIARPLEDGDGYGLKFHNNIVVGGVSSNEWSDQWDAGNNIIWSIPFAYTPNIASGGPNVVLAGLDDMFGDYDENYFEGSGNFFVGGDDFDTYSYFKPPQTVNEIFSHGVNLNLAYLLAPGSPAIGAADPANAPAVDLLGNPRDPDAPSVGCYEYIAQTERLPGDANEDMVVNLDDFIILKQNYGSTSADWSQGDFNGDGNVNLDDFIILKQNYGSVQ